MSTQHAILCQIFLESKLEVDLTKRSPDARHVFFDPEERASMAQLVWREVRLKSSLLEDARSGFEIYESKLEDLAGHDMERVTREAPLLMSFRSDLSSDSSSDLRGGWDFHDGAHRLLIAQESDATVTVLMGVDVDELALVKAIAAKSAVQKAAAQESSPKSSLPSPRK